MDRNKRNLKIDDKTIRFYDYYITNACVVKFVDADLNAIKNFFGDTIITRMQEIDEDGKIIKEENFYFKKKHVFIENTTITEKEIKIIKDAYDEEVIDEETQETIIIHHPAETETIEHVIPVEMTSVTLEKPEIEDEISSMKKDIKDTKDAINNMSIPSANQEQMMTLMGIMTLDLTDEQALEVCYFVPRWEVGVKYIGGDRVSVENESKEIELYKCIEGKDHTSEENRKPGKGTESIWERIEPDHTGTKADPIPYHTNMKVFKDKYYIEDDILYICTRDSGIALQNKASELIGHYFKIAE